MSTAVLGTDRRDPPDPPPGAFADLADVDRRSSPAGRLLQQAAAVTVVRRAGLRPSAPQTPQTVEAGPFDGRPITPPAAAHTWWCIVADWPILEDEWLLAVAGSEYRLAPDLVVEALYRHRSDPVRHARVRLAAGALGEWMMARSPRLRSVARRAVDPNEAASLPELPITPELAPLVATSAAEPLSTSGAPLLGLADELLFEPLRAGRFGPAHRPVLVHTLARVHPGLLAHLRTRLEQIPDDPAASPAGHLLALSLLDLVHRRATMLTELEST